MIDSLMREKQTPGASALGAASSVEIGNGAADESTAPRIL
jgi:hypothetical protein